MLPWMRVLDSVLCPRKRKSVWDWELGRKSVKDLDDFQIVEEIIWNLYFFRFEFVFREKQTSQVICSMHHVLQHFLRAMNFLQFYNFFSCDKYRRQILNRTADDTWAVWPDWVNYCTLGNFSKPMATIILPKLPTLLGNFLKMTKSFMFPVESFLGNFYRHLVTFYWSHCTSAKISSKKLRKWLRVISYQFSSNLILALSRN